MIWDDLGFLLSKNKFSENSIIAEIFTKNHGKISGIIFGGTSKKIKNYLQIGNQLHVNFNSKSENKAGSFKVEIQKAYSPLFFDDSKKLNCITSAMSLIKLLNADSQTNIKIYNLIVEFYLILANNDWLKKYIFWELDILKNLGYDLKFDQLVKKEIINDRILYIAKSSTEKKIVPSFLINKEESVDDLKILLNGLKLVGDYIDKTILKPNNINFPISRNQFINSLK
ncbi:DNA repair protein RecO [Candidatus Pelagibacter sp.]|nr:DNA repair protein RecO [Candidatus Pelagibacter sp.]MDA9594863.1 DNA repair protein RecO [Candidatus Pelagibacter sp.]